MDGQSKDQIDRMFVERDHDAMEWVAKRAIKKSALQGRRDGRNAPTDADGYIAAPADASD